MLVMIFGNVYLFTICKTWKVPLKPYHRNLENVKSVLWTVLSNTLNVQINRWVLTHKMNYIINYFKDTVARVWTSLFWFRRPLKFGRSEINLDGLEISVCLTWLKRNYVLGRYLSD